MSDGFLYRSLPAFTGLLVFMPACSDDPAAATDTDDPTDGSSSSTDPVTTQVTTTTSVDDSTGGDTTDDTTNPETGETGVPMCGEDAMCGATAPDGWFGPLIVARGPVEADLPECPDEYPNPGPVARDGFIDPGPALCTCECTPPVSMSCYASVVSSDNENCYGGYYYYYGYMGYGYYGGGGSTYTQVEETCTNIDIDGFARFRVNDFYNPPPCTPSTSETIPPVAWDSTIKTCAISDTPLSCSDGSLCIPAPAPGFEATWCLYQQGDAGCPAGIFNTKQKFYTGSEDDRECSDCTCGSSAANCGDGNLLLFEGPDCAGEPSGSMPGDNSCEPTVAASVAVQYGDGESTCPVASPPHSTGLAEPTGVLTFCCTG